MSITYEMNDEQVKSAIASIAGRTKTLRQDIHKAAVSILTNWAIDNNANTAKTRATELLAAVDSYKGQAIINWFSVYAGFTYTKADGFRYDSTTIEVQQVQAARAEPYWELSPPKEFKAFDLTASLLTLLDKAEKAEKNRNKRIEAGETDLPENSINPDLVQKLREALTPEVDF